MNIKPFAVTEGIRRFAGPELDDTGLALDSRQMSLEGGAVFIQTSLTNNGTQTVEVERAGLTIGDELLQAEGEWRAFIDSGTLGWNGVRRLDALEAGTQAAIDPPVDDTAGVCHRSSLQTVLWFPSGGKGLLAGFCGQKAGQNCVDTWPSADGRRVAAMEAWQEFALRPLDAQRKLVGFDLEPGEQLELDPLLVTTGRDPLEMLEDFGRVVQEHWGNRFEEPPLTGYMTWYSKGAAIDEDTVNANLPILAELLTGYPQAQRPVLILDHGWQQQASLGPDQADTGRFPEGLPRLASRISNHGLEPGLWVSLMNVTEDTAADPELASCLAADSQGQPLRGTINLWDALPGESPSRYVNVPDADSEGARAWWKRRLQHFSALGFRYFKMDFFALRTSENNRRHAASERLHNQAWRTLRESVSPDAHLAPCSCDTNLALGRCDSVRISADIGEAGQWPSAAQRYRNALSAIGASWFKHRRFWTNDPDSVQLGKGCSLGEARVRATAAAFSGGHLMLSEDLRGIDAARLEMFRRLLPAVPTAAVPLDLFDNPAPSGYPAVWRLRTEAPSGSAQAIALFNLNNETQSFCVRPEMFGFSADSEWLALEWWQYRWLGCFQGAFTLDVPPLDVAVVHAQPVGEQPAVVSCAHHPTGLYIVEDAAFDVESGILSGRLATRPGLKTVLFGYTPSHWRLTAGMKNHVIANSLGGWQCEVTTTGKKTGFNVCFEKH